MLNKPERYEVFKLFRIYSFVGLLPAQVDLTNWQLKVPSTGKRCICVVSFSFFVLHALYKIGSLAYTYLFVPEVPLHQLLIHAVEAMGAAMVTFWYHVAYISDPALFATYIQLTLHGNVGGSLDGRDELHKHWRARLREYSLQDLIAIGMPCVSTVTALVVIAAYVYDPSLRLLLYAALPCNLQTSATFVLCLLEEVRILLAFVAVGTPIWQLQIISFDLVSKQLQLLMRAIENGNQSGRSVYRFLRTLQLYVIMLNNVNSHLIFTMKLACISVSILSGYAAFAHFREYPVFGIMYYVLLVDSTFIFTVIYEKAFKIPQLFDQAAACALTRVRRNRNSDFRRQILSIPRTGVKVGNFHYMERASTLIFMDFALKNIVNMLVAYG